MPFAVNQSSSVSELKGTLFLMAGAFMISFSAVFVKLVQVGPTTAGVYRTLFGGIILAGMALARRESWWQGWPAFGLTFLGGIFFTFDLTCWHRSVHLVGPGLSTILANFQVFFLAGVGILVLREKAGLRLLVAIPLAMAGLGFLMGLHRGIPSQAHQLGVFFGVLTAMAYASYILTLRKLHSLERRPSVLVNMAIASLTTAGLMAAETVFTGEGLAIPDGSSWAWLVTYGVLGQVLGWVFISRGLPSTPASRAGLVLLLQPTLSFIWDILFFKRPTDALELLGAVLAVAGIYLGTVRAARPLPGGQEHVITGNGK